MRHCCNHPDDEDDFEDEKALHTHPHGQMNQKDASCHPTKGKRTDWILWGSLLLVVPAYASWFLVPDLVSSIPYAHEFTHSIFDLLNQMWWGIVLGVFFMGALSFIPREVVSRTLGADKGMHGIFRATLAGVMLDLCSHGILMVGAKLYERGARLGQVIAFLIASPWNSLSLTVILWALVGWKLTLAFIFLSMIIAIITGIIVDWLVAKGHLPENPNRVAHNHEETVWSVLTQHLKQQDWSGPALYALTKKTVHESQMILRWLLFGLVIASAIRTFVPLEIFQTYFGPTIIGLGLTLVAATVIEVCSEGSVPIAADLVSRAAAPGNAFTFLMAGVSTDYTEIMVLREITKSWKAALVLPLVTVPQIVALGYLINGW